MTAFEFVINLKKRQRLALPSSDGWLADQVIE